MRQVRKFIGAFPAKWKSTLQDGNNRSAFNNVKYHAYNPDYNMCFQHFHGLLRERFLDDCKHIADVTRTGKEEFDNLELLPNVTWKDLKKYERRAPDDPGAGAPGQQFFETSFLANTISEM